MRKLRMLPGIVCAVMLGIVASVRPVATHNSPDHAVAVHRAMAGGQATPPPAGALARAKTSKSIRPRKC